MLRVDERSLGHRCNSWEVVRKEGFTYKYIILDIFYDCEALIKYDMLKELMLDKEDNVMVYVFRHLS